MAINPMALLKIKERLNLFQQDHPKITPFFRVLGEKALVEGSVYELHVTTPDGEEFTGNIKLTANDVASIKMLLKQR